MSNKKTHANRRGVLEITLFKQKYSSTKHIIKRARKENAFVNPTQRRSVPLSIS